MKTIFEIKKEFNSFLHRMDESLGDKKYISYGLNKFEIEKFKPIKNRLLNNKPLGGFWACPVDSKQGWFEYVANDYTDKIPSLENNVQFTINKNANIYVIDTLDDALKLPYHINYIYQAPYFYIDYEKMAEMYDGLYITENGLGEAYSFGKSIEIDGKEVHFEFYGWDVETLLIFNPNIIENITSNEDDGKRETFEKAKIRYQNDREEDGYNLEDLYPNDSLFQ